MAMLQKKIQLASRALSLTKIILKIKMEHFEGEKKKAWEKNIEHHNFTRSWNISGPMQFLQKIKLSL